MAKFEIIKKSDIPDLLDKDLAVGDVLIHKSIEFLELEGIMKKYFPNSEVRSATVGTDLYTKHGYNTSMVTKL